MLHTNPKNSQEIGAPDHWDLPGGRLQKGHNIEQTLKREVLEEIGIQDLRILELLDASISKIRDTKKDIGRILFTYLCTINDTEKIKLTDDEHIDFGWFEPKEAAKLLLTKFSDECVKKISQLK